MEDAIQQLMTLGIFLLLAAAVVIKGQREKPPPRW